MRISTVISVQETHCQAQRQALTATVADQLDVTGWVYSISSRGKSTSGQEVEIHAVVDRSTLPVKIIEYRED